MRWRQQTGSARWAANLHFAPNHSVTRCCGAATARQTVAPPNSAFRGSVQVKSNGCFNTRPEARQARCAFLNGLENRTLFDGSLDGAIALVVFITPYNI
jgi:hypothetical protein